MSAAPNPPPQVLGHVRLQGERALLRPGPPQVRHALQSSKVRSWLLVGGWGLGAGQGSAMYQLSCACIDQRTAQTHTYTRACLHIWVHALIRTHMGSARHTAATASTWVQAADHRVVRGHGQHRLCFRLHHKGSAAGGHGGQHARAWGFELSYGGGRRGWELSFCFVQQSMAIAAGACRFRRLGCCNLEPCLGKAPAHQVHESKWRTLACACRRP